ncbi:MAG: biotin/lipoyl-containing protein [Acetobacter sp.]|uniref:acetyl-CoA carboxylase biotin carboxyl carrier protein n=1 Tax=Acetobacter sp. TaxID=440 RepID=UPI0039EAEB0C
MTGSASQIPSFDTDDIACIAGMLAQAGLETFEISGPDGTRLFIKTSQPEPQSETRHTQPPPSQKTEASGTSFAVKTPYFGVLTFTHPLRDAPFAPVGSHVKTGDVVALLTLETLQIPVVASVDGEVIEITAQEGELTGFGTEIMKICPTLAA